MGWWGGGTPAGTEDLFARFRLLKKNLYSDEERMSFLEFLKQSAAGFVERLGDRPGDDPHKQVCQFLQTVALGMRYDEFTTPKMEALERALVMLCAARISREDVRLLEEKMLWAGMLGFRYSEGRRKTVDGKY